MRNIIITIIKFNLIIIKNVSRIYQNSRKRISSKIEKKNNNNLFKQKINNNNKKNNNNNKNLFYNAIT